MRKSQSTTTRFVSGVSLAVAAVVVLATTEMASAKRPVKMRVAAEVAVGGLSVAETIARQNNLSAELLVNMPARANTNPVVVEISQQDRAAIAERPDGPAPLRVGVVKPMPAGVGMTLGKASDHGVLQRNRDGGLVWSIAVSSPDAQAIRVRFKEFFLPKNAEVYFYSENGQAHGPYTDRGRNGTGEFWTRSIAGSSGIIQLQVTGKVNLRDISFTVADLGHINARPIQPLGGIASHDNWPCSDNVACLVDANCVNGSPAEVAKDAVAKMEWITGQFINTCSGGLLADTDTGSQIPYFLTANHCLSSSISNMETFFFYTTDSCNGGCPDSLLTGGTPPPASTIGITVVATGSAEDFTLTTLDEAPPSGTTFLGWNNSPVAFTSGVSLYRVSNANFGPQVYSETEVNTTTGTCSGWPRGDRIYQDILTGSTMGGSSGAPVLNSSGEVVGQLSGCCGFNCGNECDFANNWTVDGAFAAYWNQVSQFLDPGPQVCNNDGTCDAGEDCNNCSGDCISGGGGGAVCGNGICEAGNGEDCVSCAADCNGRQSGRPSNRFCCGDGDGQNPLPCSNSTCSSGGWSCTDIPAGGGTAYCCGDGTCEGDETGANCAIDCSIGCSVPADCNDGNECTTDACIDGTCSNTAVADDTSCGGGVCCGGSCTAPACSSDGDCNDGDSCTIDTCNGAGTCSASCSNDEPPCQDGDGCCPNGCSFSNDDDCPPCQPKNGSCSSGSDCCSGICKANGRCR